MRTSIVTAAALLAACSSGEPKAAATATACNIGKDLLRPQLGQTYTDDVGNDLQRRSRSASLRVVRPGEAVTMDFRADRLTIRLDDQGRIASVTCG